MVIQQSLGRLSNNIVKVADYYEDDNAFTMVMEYSDDPSYFEDLLENVLSIKSRNIVQFLVKGH
jgi:serine/threonine protein kinase